MRGVGLDEPFFVRRGEGAYLETIDDRRLIDWVLDPIRALKGRT